eukprot:scaffold659618_cov48-Prasinocladus_malaysianus.AAC.1
MNCSPIFEFNQYNHHNRLTCRNQKYWMYTSRPARAVHGWAACMSPNDPTIIGTREVLTGRYLTSAEAVFASRARG